MKARLGTLTYTEVKYLLAVMLRKKKILFTVSEDIAALCKAERTLEEFVTQKGQLLKSSELDFKLQ
jgi:hypothetical protein